MEQSRTTVRSPRRIMCACFIVATIALAAHAQPLTFTTLAGSTGGHGSADGTGTAARFNSPCAVATDRQGNIYVADTENHTIRKITPAGNVTTLAGLAGSSGSADGTGSVARFNEPRGVAVDSAGNIYVADNLNHTIRKITPKAAVTTLAGLPGVPGSADGKGAIARFFAPEGVATDSSGNVYVSDGSNTIRKITPEGVVTTFAGTPRTSGSADGIGGAARFNQPAGLATDAQGNVYVADGRNRAIRKIAPTGEVTTLAGSAALGGSSSSLPVGITTDGGGMVYVADLRDDTIRKITPAGAVTTLAGSVEHRAGVEDGTGGVARFSGPYGLAADARGNLYVAERSGNTIRKITPAGVVTTLAGPAVLSGRDDGVGNTARFAEPEGVATDGAGNVYVADGYYKTIRKITPPGIVTTLAGSPGHSGKNDGTGSNARFSGPTGLAIDKNGNLYAPDGRRIRKITPAGLVTTLAGSDDTGDEDGTGNAARFGSMHGTAVDRAGNVYVADSSNNTIRKITAAGVVTTLAGSPRFEGSQDGSANTARFSFPTGVAVDRSGTVYVADNSNHTIRKITPSGVVTTFAGAAGVSGSVDGTGGAARFRGPYLIATDGNDNLYVVDKDNHTIRKVTPAGVVTTMGGSPSVSGTADGTGSVARFCFPDGVAVDTGGNVYVTDTLNSRVLVGKPPLADTATIDRPTAVVGETRKLGTSAQTAKAWQWRIVRKSAASSAALSSTSIRNPVFTPDVADLYIFQLTATDGVRTSITTVELTAVQRR